MLTILTPAFKSSKGAVTILDSAATTNSTMTSIPAISHTTRRISISGRFISSACLRTMPKDQPGVLGIGLKMAMNLAPSGRM